MAYSSPSFAAGVVQQQRLFRSACPDHATAFLLVSGVAYFCYLGRLTADTIPKFVEFDVGTIGAGAQTAEVGLFSSPLPANKSAQSMTLLVATATFDALTTTGVKRNTSAFAVVVPGGTYLWAGIRTALATTQPSLAALTRDRGRGGSCQRLHRVWLTGAGPWTGAIVAGSLVQCHPDLSVTLD